MYRGASLLGVVPARGGSKGLPNKNILNCAGKPLIGWTIAAARNSGVLDDVMVSTDSSEIATIARQCGAAVPFMRPIEFASDGASMLSAIGHAWENQHTATGTKYDYVVILQPTSPLRHEAHISAAVKWYFQQRKSDADTLVSVTEVSPKLGWLMSKTDEGYVRFCLDIKAENPQRQHLDSYYLPNGAIYIAKGDSIGLGFYGDATIPFVMSESDSLDIDTSAEFDTAETRLGIRNARARGGQANDENDE